jgi:hypothetical protein
MMSKIFEPCCSLRGELESRPPGGRERDFNVTLYTIKKKIV